jgi:hypothetical protein
MRLPGGHSAALGALIAASACSMGHEVASGPMACVEPVISRYQVTGNPTNVLSALVSADVRWADSVVVRFGIGSARDSATPPLATVGDSVLVPVLMPVFGLLPSTTYGVEVVAYNRCGTSTGQALPLVTGPLPIDLPAYSAEGAAPSPGFVVFAAGKYGLVIDNSGRVVWYHAFPDGPGLNFQAQPNGRYAARPPAAAESVATWVEISPAGDVTRSLGCARGLQPRMHDLIAQPDGSYWLLCDELRTMDLSGQGASREARVLGTSVQRRGADGEVLFAWSPFDHFQVDLLVLEPPDRVAPVINWTHGNAMDLDDDGNLLVSFRNLSEVTRIDTRTGAVIWRMGGARNEFTFDSADMPPFARQHGVRSTGRGQLLLLDNLGQRPGSRAEHYSVDGERHAARLTGTNASAAGLVAETGGSAQALHDGHTLVSYGSGGGVEEYDAAGRVVWRLTGKPGYVFRAQRIRSLYRPGAGDPR